MSILTIALIIALAAIVALIFALSRTLDENDKLQARIAQLERQVQERSAYRMALGEMAVVG